jgi:mRNA interferase MazF
MVRGEVFRLPAPRSARGREQSRARYAVVVQANELLALSTVLVAPTSTGASPATFRPEIRVGGTMTRVMTDQLRAVDAGRLGRSAGRLEASELYAVDRALATVLSLNPS